MTNLNQMILADLKKSGLTRQNGEKMRLRGLQPEEMKQIFPGVAVPAYEIPYFDLDGKAIDYARYKLLEPHVPKGDKKPAKYLQLPGTKPHFYFPPFLDWRRVASDTSIPVYFVEGEKKSVALARLGYAAIGLGGIWAWRTSGDEGASELIGDFNLIDCKNRKAIIAFDADV